MKQAHTPTTTKVHYKLYKAGKFWLVGTLATVSLVAGLAVTNSAQADTTGDKDSATSAVSSSSSSTSADSATLSSSNQDSQSSITSQSTSSNNDTSTTTPAKNTDVSTATNTTTSTPTTQSDTQKKATTPSVQTTTKPKSTPVSTAAVTAASGYSATSAVKSLLAPKRSFKHVTTRLSVAAVPEVTATTPGTGKDINGTIITATPISVVPHVSNFYVSVKGKVVPYNSYASASLLPYSTEFLKPNEELYGFYVVLPKSITATLADVKKGAQNYVDALAQDIDPTTDKPYIQLSQLTVYQLDNSTQDNRQVFYFQPDSDAKVNSQGSTKGYGGQLKMSVAVKTTSDESIKELNLNAAGYSQGDTTTLPFNDVLFAGIGDYSNYPYGSYLPMASSNFGANWPDLNIVGISADNGAATLNYHEFTVTDKFIGYLTGTTTTAAYSTNIPAGPAGTTYTMSDYVTDAKVAARVASNALYWKPSTRYVGTKIGNTLNIHDDGTAVLPETATLNPTSLDLNVDPDNPVYTTTGITYVFYLDAIKTKLTPKDTTVTVNSTWTPDANLTIVTPSGATDLATLKNEGTLTTTITNSERAQVSANTFTKKIGTYQVSYSYKDNQGNTTSATANITVNDTKSSVSVPSTVNLIAGQTWVPSSIATIADSKGNPISNTDGLTITKDDSKTPVNASDAFDTSTLGSYVLTYSYTDDAGVIRTANTTVTINPNQGALTATDITATANTSWDPSTAVKSLIAPDGTNVNPADALADKSLTVTVKDKDGNPVTIDSSTTPGTYTVIYHYTDPTTKLDVVSDPVTLTIAPAPTTGGSGTNTGTTTPDNGETPTTPTTPVKPTNPGKTTKPAKTVRPVKPVTVKGVAIKDPPIRAIGEPQYTPGIQTGVTVNNSPLSGGEAAAALENQNGQANPATVLSQAQADQLAADQVAAREAARNADANNANQQNQQNQLADGTNATTLPQTNDHPTTWTAQLGVLLLGLTGALGFRRKRN